MLIKYERTNCVSIRYLDLLLPPTCHMFTSLLPSVFERCSQEKAKAPFTFVVFTYLHSGGISSCNQFPFFAFRFVSSLDSLESFPFLLYKQRIISNKGHRTCTLFKAV